MSTPPLKRLRSSDDVNEDIYINRIEDDDNDEDNADVDETFQASSSNPGTSCPLTSDPSFANDLTDVRECLQDIAQTLSSLQFHEVVPPTEMLTLLPGTTTTTMTTTTTTLIPKWNVWIQCDMSPRGDEEGFFQRDLYKIYRLEESGGGGGGGEGGGAVGGSVNKVEEGQSQG